MHWLQSISPSEQIAVSLIQGTHSFILCIDEMRKRNEMPDEQHLIDCLSNSRLIPFFYTSFLNDKHLEEYFSTDFAIAIKNHYKASVLKHLQLEGTFRAIAPLLQQEGIDFIPFKGIALSQQIYAKPTLRPMLDIDMLVAPQNITKAKDILLNIGAVPLYEIESKHTMGRWRHIPPLVYRGIPIELHQQLFLPHEELFHIDLTKNTVSEDIYHIPCRTLLPEYHLFYLIYHLHKHAMQGYIRLIWLLDIRLFWEKHHQTLNTKILESLLDQSKRLYNHSLAAIQLILNICIIKQPKYFDKIDIDQAALHLLRCINKNNQKQNIKSIKVLREIDGTKGKILFVLGRLFPTPSYVISKYKITLKTLLPVYYILIYISYMQKLMHVLSEKAFHKNPNLF